MLPFTGLSWGGRSLDQWAHWDTCKHGELEIGPILGSGAGTTVRQAWFQGRHMAVKMANDPQDEYAAGLIVDEGNMLRSKEIQPFVGKPTVNLVATGCVYGSPFLGLERMGASTSDG